MDQNTFDRIFKRLDELEELIKRVGREAEAARMAAEKAIGMARRTI